VQKTPAYLIDSVDHALQLATILQQEGPLRLTDAAARLGVARSTAHRLLAMLVYREFAERDEDRRYVAGPVLRHAATPQPVADLRRVALPHLQYLADRTDETTNLVVMVGDQVRFVASVECAQVLRVGDREGRTLPARLTSGGRALLAALPDDEAVALHPTLDPAALLRDLRRVRRAGFAVNNQQTEIGVTAIGCAVPGAVPGKVTAAVSIAMPTARYRRELVAGWARDLAGTAEQIARELGTSSHIVAETVRERGRSDRGS